SRRMRRPASGTGPPSAQPATTSRVTQTSPLALAPRSLGRATQAVDAEDTEAIITPMTPCDDMLSEMDSRPREWQLRAEWSLAVAAAPLWIWQGVRMRRTAV